MTFEHYCCRKDSNSSAFPGAITFSKNPESLSLYLFMQTV